MKFVALISGGKDSCFNVLHCLKQGHELVALANLRPADSTQQELDSYMFQTVGHDIVPCYSQCTGLPLFRKEIRPNSSKNLDLNYTPTLNDEIEDLYDLLSQVQKEIPDLEAVSVGAILSSYQRTRVEDVCGRLGLVALCYLWQRDQMELMKEMCMMSSQATDESDSGILEARLIKVAAIGLDQSSLSKSLPEVFPTLINLHKLYDVHVCGEGGEFETMVLDAPFFSKGKLKLLSQNLLPQESHDGVFNTSLNVEFQKRELSRSVLQRHLDSLPTPNLFDAKWQNLLGHIQDVEKNEPLVSSLGALGDSRKSLPLHYVAHKQSVTKVGELMFISNLSSNADTLEQQLKDIFEKLDAILTDYDIKPSMALNCSLILADMSLFARVNEVYSNYFDVWKNGPLPPARACIASKAMAKGCLVQVSLTFDVSSKDKTYKNKNGLHVQGRSYWAPSNIGPYSQATWLQSDPNKIVFISGQIALEPASMKLAAPNFIIQAALSLRHFATLKNTIEAKVQLSMVCLLSRVELVSIVARVWQLYCSDMAYESDLWMNKEDDNKECLIIVKVSELPRAGLCEWSGITCQNSIVEEDEHYQNANESLELLSLQNINYTTVSNAKGRRYFLTGFADSNSDLLHILELVPRVSKITLFFNPEHISPDLLALVNTEYYPVQNVYNFKGDSKRYGFHIIF